MSDKEIYNKEWLVTIRISVHAASNILPTYWIDKEDPEEIQKLKTDLDNFKMALDELAVRIHKMEKKCLK